MQFGTSNFIKKHREDREHICSHTLILSVNVPKATWAFDFGIRNYSNANAAFIDWGDGSTETAKSSSDAFEKFNHTYSAKGTYTVTFDMNADISWPSSYFFVCVPPDILEGSTSETIRNASRGTTDVVEVLDFNPTQLGDAMFLNEYCNPFVYLNQARIKTHLLHRLKKSSHFSQYKRCMLNKVWSDSRDNGFLMTDFNTTYGSHMMNFPELDKFVLPTPPSSLYKGWRHFSFFKDANMPKLNDFRYLGPAFFRQTDPTPLRHLDLSDPTNNSASLNAMLREQTALSSITFPTGLNKIVSYDFEKTSIEELELPSTVKTLEACSFEGSGLKSFTLPSTVTTIVSMNYMFKNSAKIEHIDLSSYKNEITAGNQSFFGCKKLKDVILPSGLSLIGEDYFNGCTSLSSVEGMKSIKTIGKKAFYDCTALKTLDMSTIETLDGNNERRIQLQECRSCER